VSTGSTYRRFQQSRKNFLGLLYPKDENSTLLRHVCIYLPVDSAWYFRRPESSLVSLWEPQISTLWLLYLLPLCLSVTALNRSSVPVRLRAADGVLVPSELPYHCSNSGSSADAGAVSAGDAGVHVRTVRLSAGLHGVSTVCTLCSNGNTTRK
jgi:hypothetical protein